MRNSSDSRKNILAAVKFGEWFTDESEQTPLRDSEILTTIGELCDHEPSPPPPSVPNRLTSGNGRPPS